MARVARRIWARAMKLRYGAGERSQKFKVHIQTSGRSLHAQEVQFNEFRTTLQALVATNDNCNSLHTNAYDEAITTPTPESVRRAVAIQKIIRNEFGMAWNENPLSGSFVVAQLTDLVRKRYSPNSIVSMLVAACWRRWSASTSETGSRKSRSCMRPGKTPARFRSSE